MLRPFGHSVSDMLVVVGSSLKMVKFEPATANMTQHVATGWPNACNMLRPTMLWYVALNCCGLLVDRGLSKSFKSCLRFVCDSAGRRMSKMCYNCDLSESNSPPLNADQTESQVDASWELASTCDSVWPGLACTCVDVLAMTCAHFGRDQIFTQVDASFSPFGHPAQVNASWVTSINLLLANEIQDTSALKWAFLRPACTCEETCESVWPPNASLYASSTCGYLRLLASPFDQGFISITSYWV